MRLFLSLCVLILLVGCVTHHTVEKDPANFLNQYELSSAQEKQDFIVCQGNGCKQRSKVSFEETWPEIQTLFKNVSTAVEERRHIAKAISLFEKSAGTQTNTHLDKGGNLQGIFEAGQQDCIDETLNTTRYLLLLQNQNLLKFHRTSHPIGKGLFFDEWPHHTATVQDKQTGIFYVVDSWYLANGAQAVIMPLDEWLQGGSPERIAARTPYRIDENGSWTPAPPWLESQ